ncbi:hypothetical protein ABVT39_013672 [Epinephelus coioides]
MSPVFTHTLGSSVSPEDSEPGSLLGPGRNLTRRKRNVVARRNRNRNLTASVALKAAAPSDR